MGHEFIGYEKMPENVKKWNLTAGDYQLFKKVDWCVTEKVHGANFCFLIENNKSVYTAKRKEILNYDEDFFGFQLVLEKYREVIQALGKELLDKYYVDRITIYGELFGGAYPHEDVPQDDRVQAIQTGVYYSPTINFYGFDITLEKEGERTYLDYKEVIELFEKYQVFYAKPLQIGSYNEVLEYNIDVNSIIPAWLGLPEISDNLIEGVVVKPMKELDLPTKVRPILKIKSSRFKEDKRYHQAVNWNFDVTQFQNEQEELSFLWEEMQNLVTNNRLNNAISKIGFPSSEGQIKAITELFIQDVFDAFNEISDNLLNDLNEKTKEKLITKIHQQTQKFLNN